MSFKPCIYGLVDPLEPEHVRYIGKASYEARPKEHRMEAVRAEYTNYKLNWIRKLLTAGRMYSIIVLEEYPVGTTSEELNESEIRLIAEYKEKGHRLTNATAGGEGMSNPSPETRSKLRALWTLEKRAKLAKANSDRTSDQRGRMGDATSARMTEEYRNKLSEMTTLRQTGKKASTEIKTKIRDSIFEFRYGSFPLEERINKLQERILCYIGFMEKPRVYLNPDLLRKHQETVDYYSIKLVQFQEELSIQNKSSLPTPCSKISLLQNRSSLLGLPPNTVSEILRMRERIKEYQRLVERDPERCDRYSKSIARFNQQIEELQAKVGQPCQE